MDGVRLEPGQPRRARSRRRPRSRSEISPGRPGPTALPSRSVTGVTSAVVPAMKISSARYRSSSRRPISAGSSLWWILIAALQAAVVISRKRRSLSPEAAVFAREASPSS